MANSVAQPATSRYGWTAGYRLARDIGVCVLPGAQHAPRGVAALASS